MNQLILRPPIRTPAHFFARRGGRKATRHVAALSPSLVFSASSAVMVPVSAMMVLQPRSQLTRKLLIDSPILPISLSLVYLALIVQGIDVIAPLIRSACQGWHALPLANASSLGDLFTSPVITSISWIHLLLVDFLQARWILTDGSERSVFTAHSVALSFFVGPLGLLSHIITKMIFKDRYF